MTKSQSIVRGAFFIVASELSFALGAAVIKLVSASLPNESIVFFRNLFGLIILTPLFALIYYQCLIQQNQRVLYLLIEKEIHFEGCEKCCQSYLEILDPKSVTSA